MPSERAATITGVSNGPATLERPGPRPKVIRP